MERPTYWKDGSAVYIPPKYRTIHLVHNVTLTEKVKYDGL